MSDYTIGIDIGGTNMRSVLFNGEKEIESCALSTPDTGLDKFYSIFKALNDPLLERAKQDKKRINGIGLSIAGIHDLKEGKIIYSPNINYLNGVEIIKEIEKKNDLPVKLDNDTNSFLRAEAKIGAGQKYNNIFGMTLGTDIGGAWWLNNKVYRGSHGSAGEITHTIADFPHAKTLMNLYQELTSKDPATIAEAAYRGDEKGEGIFKELGEYLGYACANIVNLIDPEVIIIGGGVAESSDLFLPVAKKKMQENIVNPLSQNTKIIKAKLGKNAGAIGSALLF
jgi:glucokinase